MLTLKTVTIGQSTVGKTSIVCRLINDHCDEKVMATVGASFMTYKHDNIKYSIWDTAGQERFRSLMPMYFRDAKIMIFVFDVSNMNTLNDLSIYLPNLANIDNYSILVIGNKIDLIDDEQLKEVIEKTREKLRESPIFPYIFDKVFVSAKNGENFDTLRYKLDTCARMFETEKHFNTYKIVNLEKVEVNIEEKRCTC